jgi:putative flippase GtrA
VFIIGGDPLAEGTMGRTAAPAPVFDVVIPVFNEEADLAASVERLHAYLSENVPYTFRITVADNASTDNTPVIAAALAAELAGVRVVTLSQKGKGRAVRAVWAESDASVLAYMDVDLSTDLAAFLPLIAPLISGHSDVSIGTRLHRTARVTRGAKREFISRSYNLMLRHTLATRFSDAHCGFKALRREVAAMLLPLVEDNGWFFDAELLIVAERAGLRIHEVPVDWVDDPNSKVKIVSTALDDLRGIARIARSAVTGRLPLQELTSSFGRAPASNGLAGQLFRFSAVGVLSTLAYVALFLGLSGPFGAQGANVAALALSTIGNTALNRHFTFGVKGWANMTQHQLQASVVFLLALALTSTTLFTAHGIFGDPGRLTELGLLVVANGAATLVRFLMLRRWVFRPTAPVHRDGVTAPAVPDRRPIPAQNRRPDLETGFPLESPATSAD